MTQEETQLYERENELLERVWNRVASAAEQKQLPSPAQQDETLRAFFADESGDYRYYKRLSRRYGAKASVFSSIAADELRHVRRLAAAYFLSTGDRLSPPVSRTGSALPDYCTALRIRILAERAGAAAYEAAAQETDDLERRQLYWELAAEERTHARILRELLEAAL